MAAINELVTLGIGTPAAIPALILVGLSPSAAPAATTYYVSNAGNNANDGLTPATAWQTSAKVTATALIPDDMVLFNKGDTFGYFEVDVSGTAGHPITFSTYGTGARPIFTNRTILGSGWTNAGSNRWTHALTPAPTQVFFNSTRGTLEVSQVAVNAANEWYWAANVLTVYSTSDPATAYTSPGIQQDGGGTVGSIAAYDQDYLVFIGLEATLSAYGFWMGGPGSHNTLSDCVGSWCYYDGISFLAGNTYGTVTNCFAHDNAHNGLTFAVDANFATVTGGGYYNNAYGSSDMFPGGIGVSFYQSTDGAVTGVEAYHNTYGFKTFDPLTARISFITNVANDNSLFGIDIDTSGADCLVESNDVFANGTHQIAVENSSTGTIVRYNFVHDGPALAGASGIEILGTNNTEVIYNLIWNMENGLALSSNPVNSVIENNTITAVTNACITASFDNASISGITMKNNIADASIATRVVDCGIYTIAAFVSDYNDWYSGGGAKMVYNNVALTLAGWRTATSQDVHAIDANPLFVGGGDFSLQPISPCLNAGVNVGRTRDIDGVPVSNPPDMGAYESIGGGGGGGELNPALAWWPRLE